MRVLVSLRVCVNSVGSEIAFLAQTMGGCIDPHFIHMYWVLLCLWTDMIYLLELGWCVCLCLCV